MLPTFAATAVDFFASTVLLAGVVGMASGERALRIWRQNYQWGLPSYLTGSTIALLVAWLYLAFGIAGLILVLPPLYLIYYSYDIYVQRVRDSAAFGAEIASFKEELAASSALHDELRATQTKVAAEIERARRIQHDLLPADPRPRAWAWPSSSASSSSARWAATTTTTSTSATAARRSSAATSWARASPPP